MLRYGVSSKITDKNDELTYIIQKLKTAAKRYFAVVLRYNFYPSTFKLALVR